MSKTTICGIVYNTSGQILIGTKNSWNNHWGFLGGNQEKGESEIDTFIREVHEESDIMIIGIKKLEEYFVELENHIESYDVKFYAGRALNTHIKKSSEMKQILWVDPTEAVNSYKLFPSVEEVIKKHILYNSKSRY